MLLINYSSIYFVSYIKLCDWTWNWKKWQKYTKSKGIPMFGDQSANIQKLISTTYRRLKNVKSQLTANKRQMNKVVLKKDQINTGRSVVRPKVALAMRTSKAWSTGIEAILLVRCTHNLSQESHVCRQTGCNFSFVIYSFGIQIGRDFWPNFDDFKNRKRAKH